MKAKAVQTGLSRAALRPVSRTGRKRRQRPPLLQIPSEALKPAEIVLANCTDDGRRRFLDELHTALQSKDPIAQLWFTIESWYRTLVVISDPQYPNSLEAATKAEGTPLTLEEFRARLGI